MNENGEVQTEEGCPTEDRTAWQTYFPYDTPYDQQIDGIEGVMEVCQNGNFALMEGECGTGKTHIALNAGIALKRNPNTRFQRVLCTTSVKQQLEAFVNDLQDINENLPPGVDPVSGLQVVGKPDVCSWVDEGTLSERGIYRTCNDLRDPIWSAIGKEERRRDPERGKRTALESLLEDKRVKKDSEWPPAVSGSDWTAPVRDEHNLYDDDDYCAFYARHLLNEMNQKAPFEFDGLMTTRDVIRKSSENGVCPHAALGSRLEDAEVIIANYRHVFDSRTRKFTEEIIDESTLVVFDEAHTMEQEVRDMLELEAGLSDFAAALEEATEILHTLESTDPTLTGVKNAFQSELRRWGLETEDLRTFEYIVSNVSGWIANETDTALNTDRYRLREPDEIETDAFTEWIKKEGIAEDCLRAEYIGEAIKRARDAAAQSIEDYPREGTKAPGVGQLLTAWVRRDGIDNYQSLDIRRTDTRIGTHERVSVSFASHRWNGSFDPHLVLKNCIPREMIAETLGEFGGGLLMSATLQPIDAYETAIGIDRIGTGNTTNGSRPSPTPKEDNDEINNTKPETGTGEKENTPPSSRQFTYGLHFPPENRVSMAVDLPRFTYGNRDDPDSHEGEETRRKYARVIRDVVTGIDGNVMIAMPSYGEAEWAASVLRGDWSRFDQTMQETMRKAIDKDILVDKSSSNEETQTLKHSFYSGEPKVLLTSLRGTLTEGVDFSGEKLKGCLVCGVPIRNIGSDHAKAIQTAYGRAFEGNGFENAFAVPAVRKARQAIGRVIRSTSDVGVRVLADERYTTTKGRGSVREHIPEHSRGEYQCIQPDDVSSVIRAASLGE